MFGGAFFGEKVRNQRPPPAASGFASLSNNGPSFRCWPG